MKKDLVFETLAEVCGWGLDELTTTQRGRINQAAKEIRAAAEPVIAAEIRKRANYWKQKYPDASITPQSLTKEWSGLKPPTSRYGPPVEREPEPDISPEERAANRHRLAQMIASLGADESEQRQGEGQPS